MKNNIDVDKLNELLKVKTIKQAAVHLSLPYHVVYSFCKKKGYKSLVKKHGPENKTEQYIDEVVNCYLDGMSQADIAEKLGLSRRTIAVLVKKGAHHMRTRSEAAKLRDAKLSPDQLKERARAANAVRHAMGIIKTFSF